MILSQILLIVCCVINKCNVILEIQSGQTNATPLWSPFNDLLEVGRNSSCISFLEPFLIIPVLQNCSGTVEKLSRISLCTRTLYKTIFQNTFKLIGCGRILGEPWSFLKLFCNSSEKNHKVEIAYIFGYLQISNLKHLKS